MCSQTCRTEGDLLMCPTWRIKESSSGGVKNLIIYEEIYLWDICWDIDLEACSAVCSWLCKAKTLQCDTGISQPQCKQTISESNILNMLTVDVPDKLKARFNKWDNLQIALPSVVSFMGDLLKLRCFLNTGGISSFQYQVNINVFQNQRYRFLTAIHRKPDMPLKLEQNVG